jgi:uncharacterized protein with ParB-like and HNH nuclease domain
MQAQTKSVVKTLDEGVFDIPEYQRSYSWEQNQREDFFQDIKYLPDDTSHFFGNIILREKSEKYDAEVGQEKVFDVVDGQQRLTTVKYSFMLPEKLMIQSKKN